MFGSVLRKFAITALKLRQATKTYSDREHSIKERKETPILGNAIPGLGMELKRGRTYFEHFSR